MVTPRPLKLRSQLAPSRQKREEISSHLPVARIWVDTGVFHLDSPFDYLVPASMSDQAQVGARVEVELGKNIREGMICQRVEKSDSSMGLKNILKVTSPIPLATPESLDIIEKTSKRWGGCVYDILPSAIPPRIVSVEKDHSRESENLFMKMKEKTNVRKELLSNSLRLFWALPAFITSAASIANLAYARSEMGQVLVILPDERELLAFLDNFAQHGGLNQIARLDGHISRGDRYRNYLNFIQGKVQIAVGLRGAIFTPLQSNATIIVGSESSPLLFEPRRPGWNVRDVAIMRASENRTNLIFASFTPSLEVGRLIDIGWLTMISSSRRISVNAANQEQGELIPSKIFSQLRVAVNKGAVLFLVPTKGYSNAVLCAKCRNVALCSCGGRLAQKATKSWPSCVLCERVFENWRCDECQSSAIYLAARGIDRFVEEIGRAFPNSPIVNSSGEHIVSRIQPGSTMVVATLGSEPEVAGGYCAVVVLEGVRFFGYSQLRSVERIREEIFSAASLLSEDGSIICALDPSHPMLSALARWNAAPMVRRELADRAEVGLPPFRRFISIQGATKEIATLHSGLLGARKDLRIGADLVINPPRVGSQDRAAISLSASYKGAQSLMDFLHELQRRRSTSRKELFTILVDPYDLI